MANKKTKDSDVFPEYKIDNYKKCISWGLKEWADALSFRFAMRSAWNGIINPSHSFLSVLEENSCDSLINRVKKHLHNDSIYLFRDPSYGPVAQLSEYNPFILRSDVTTTHIFNQSAADLFQFKMNFFYESPRYSEWVKRSVYLKKTGMSDSMSKELVQEWTKFLSTPAWKMHAECSKSGTSIPLHQMFISVDLCAPDDILRKEFKTWLKQIRKDTQLPTLTDEINSVDFTNWHSERLLPFLDLTFWKIIHNEEIDYEEIGNTLYPGDESIKGKEIHNKEALCSWEKLRDADRIEGTLEPRALKIVSEEYVSALNNQLHRPTKKPRIRKKKVLSRA